MYVLTGVKTNIDKVILVINTILREILESNGKIYILHIYLNVY